MPVLHHLREAGFSVWPFDSPRSPPVIEIYPRLLTGEVNKRDQGARAAHLPLFGWQPSAVAKLAVDTEHAFDAACSALVMNRFLDEIMDLGTEAEPYSVEGKIWAPASPTFSPGGPLPPYIEPVLPNGPFIFEYPDHATDGGPFDSRLASPIETEVCQARSLSITRARPESCASCISRDLCSTPPMDYGSNWFPSPSKRRDGHPRVRVLSGVGGRRDRR
jgi:hypothetical protein